jgi:dimethylargininase
MAMNLTVAITRRPWKNFNKGLTTAKLGEPNYELALEQHAAYVDALKKIGLRVIELDPQPAYPDAHFVEDTAVVTPTVAVITHPGAASRQGEEQSIAEVLAPYRELENIQAPGTLDGGDVLMVGNHFLIGISERTNPEGAEQLGRIVEKYGNTVSTVEVGAGLHFKSSVNYLGQNRILVTQAFKNHKALGSYDKITVDRKEEYAANTLWINDHLLTPRGFPLTKEKLSRLGQKIIELDMSEMQKMDGGLTCLSIRF